MRTPRRKTQFDRDIYLLKRRGKDMAKIEPVTNALIAGKPPDKKYKDHPLQGEYKDRRECHIEPDWLLIYKLDKETVTFERTGSHSDLFE